MPSKHARLSPSAAERWMHCPRSVALSEQFPNETSPAAEEGTEAHALCEYLLLKAIGSADAQDPRPDMKCWTPQMQEAAEGYAAQVKESADAIAAMRQRLEEIEIEQRREESNLKVNRTLQEASRISGETASRDFEQGVADRKAAEEAAEEAAETMVKNSKKPLFLIYTPLTDPLKS